MTRSIKFRAWDKKANRWIRADESGLLFLNFETAHTGAFYIHDESGTGYDDYNISQFTGLHDREGREIYEGDIVESHLIIRRFSDDPGAKVIWESEHAAFKLNEKAYLVLMSEDRARKHYEVIGNIWENPELLEKRDKT